MEDPAAEGKQLEQAIAALESQRANLGDKVVDAAQAALREKLNSLRQTQREKEVAPQSERRILTILFCDVTGSTAMAEQMDPEEWTGIMNAAFSHLIEPVYRYGGTVSRLLGDAVLAFFGAPLAHEDDPVRACRAALEMIEGGRSAGKRRRR
jgi:class 3 adenylate cyclase